MLTCLEAAHDVFHSRVLNSPHLHLWRLDADAWDLSPVSHLKHITVDMKWKKNCPSGKEYWQMTDKGEKQIWKKNHFSWVHISDQIFINEKINFLSKNEIVGDLTFYLKNQPKGNIFVHVSLRAWFVYVIEERCNFSKWSHVRYSWELTWRVTFSDAEWDQYSASFYCW